MMIRLGVPLTGGALIDNARALGAPLMISAGAFMRRWPDWCKPFPGFRPAGPQLAGLDIALDSAGFVAMVKYRGYDWTVAQYLDLVESYPWSWWSQMDLCCEPEVAADRETIRFRIAETSRLYGECAREARHRGLKPPLPIVQGWRPDDYARAVAWTPPGAALIGVGSVCRRSVPGLVAVVERLDRELDPGTELHLFGVKSEAVRVLKGHPRVFSVDSMAWDFASRRQNRGANTMPKRCAVMTEWYRRQVATAAQNWPYQTTLPLEQQHPPDPVPEDLLQLIANGEIELCSVGTRFLEEWMYLDDEDD